MFINLSGVQGEPIQLQGLFIIKDFILNYFILSGVQGEPIQLQGLFIRKDFILSFVPGEPIQLQGLFIIKDFILSFVSGEPGTKNSSLRSTRRTLYEKAASFLIRFRRTLYEKRDFSGVQGEPCTKKRCD